MNMQMLIPLGNLPINAMLIILDKPHIAFQPAQNFKEIIITGVDEDSTVVLSSKHGIRIGTLDFIYNHAYPYKEIPELLKWLKSLSLPPIS